MREGEAQLSLVCQMKIMRLSVKYRGIILSRPTCSNTILDVF